MLTVSTKGMLLRGFRVSRSARDRYQFSAALISAYGNATFPTFRDARLFAQHINQRRDLIKHPEQTARAGQLNAMGLIDEILRYVSALYRQQRNPQALSLALSWLDEHIGPETVNETLCRFAEEFPPLAVYQRETTAADYLTGETDGGSHRQFVLEELLMVWLANMNTAYAPYLELFDDASLKEQTAYLRIIESLRAFFATQPTFGPDNQSLIDMLRSPALAAPHSLAGQLDFILSRWGYLLEGYLYRLLSSLDLIKEEEKAIFAGPGPSLVCDYAGMLDEPERFSQDRDWMPCLVLMAKNTYVWLDQLSKKYQRAITKLDDIPDEELDTLARHGFTGLWLIGVWERSAASQRIKQWCGNPEAVASAYSIQEYRTADDLGGEDALKRLKARAWQRGIRLASDMVPNHMGIDSQWVIEHPDWFISLDYTPFPAYSFNGGNLSHDDRIGIYIEDHYYNHADAAVVFKRVDHWTGDVKYIYHGNDGTNMPWNDTAQLNFLKAEVREAVIQAILHVARNFQIIRFDAAMTLAKRHYQRLWFPEPGSGGAIPTRAEHGLTRPRFNEVFPVEFWREVVDRVAQEVPDTLLLAEAFWLMEGYFVRTLGMHRVYNSAFMNMLRDEDNAKYRSVIKNTMEFDLDIIKRFVNFMNNPDERTAVDQFGTGDKYFGICTMMATLPGLPMFGHGQIEGFAEKYGMEYRRAYWDEQVNQGLVDRHEREIFPLLHRRYIFAEAQNFRLYDFYTPEGYVNEDVFAYSNRAGNERGLVVYHNKFATTRGWIRNSAAYLDKTRPERGLVQQSLGDGLNLRNDENNFTIFRDHRTNLEYIRSSRELCEQGLYVELNAYQCQTFLDFREVCDNAWGHYRRVCAALNGQGVPSIDQMVRGMFLQPINDPFKVLVSTDLFRRFVDARVTDPKRLPNADLLDEIEAQYVNVLHAAKSFTGGVGDENLLAEQLRQRLAAALQLPILQHRFPLLDVQQRESNTPAPWREIDCQDPILWATLFGWLTTHALGDMMGDNGGSEQSRAWIDEWLLGNIFADTMQALSFGQFSEHALLILRIFAGEQQWFAGVDDAPDAARTLLLHWLQDADIQRLWNVNRYNDTIWYNQEGLTEFLRWAWLVLVVMATTDDTASSADIMRKLQTGHDLLSAIYTASQQAEYQIEKLLGLLSSPTEETASLTEA